MRRRNLPTVVVDSPAIGGEPPHDFIGIDDAAGAEAAVRHLLDLGHRRLGILSFGLCDDSRPGPIDITQHAHATATVTKGRLEGCSRAVAAAGIDPASVPAEQLPIVTADLARAATHALLDRAPGTTALFAFSDRMALAARQAAGERGLSVPGDLSIVGFDDIAPAAEGLTTVHQPLREKGRIAAERLLRAIGDQRPPGRGRSCCPPGSWSGTPRARRAAADAVSHAVRTPGRR